MSSPSLSPIPAVAQPPSRAVVILFWLCWSINAIVAAVFLYFFAEGLSDGTVSSTNMLLWLGILAGVGLILVGSLLLRAKGKPLAGMFVGLILAGPGLAFGLFFLILILSHPRWN